MIFEAMSKYDAEIAKCTEYYSEQCAAMEVCRGQIAAANYVAANSRALILDAQANINRCEVSIPTRKYELKQHLLKCKAELFKLDSRLKIVMGGIAALPGSMYEKIFYNLQPGGTAKKSEPAEILFFARSHDRHLQGFV